MASFHGKHVVFLCSKDAVRDTNWLEFLTGNRFFVSLTPFRNQVFEHCRNRNDKWKNIVETRINCSNDLVADEAVYHKECLKKVYAQLAMVWSS